MSVNRRVSAGSSKGSDHGSQFDVEDGYRRKLKETDPHRLEQRQKAIDKGVTTKAYQNYIRLIPKLTRPSGTTEDEMKYPRTPDKFEICSKRGWDGKVRAWRVRLHQWAPEGEADAEVIQIPTAMSRKERAEVAQQLTSPQQGRKRERDGNEENTSNKRLSLGGPGGKALPQEQPLRISPLKVGIPSENEHNQKVSDEGDDNNWTDPILAGNKTIFDAWDEDEEENIEL